MIIGIVVLYNPSPQRVTRLLTSIIPQVATVVAVDNTPESGDVVPSFLRGFAEHVHYVPLGINKGIGEAQNVGIEKAISLGGTHVLLLDQDSAPSDQVVERLLAAETALLSNGLSVAAVGPRCVEEKTGASSCAIHHSFFGMQRIALEEGSGVPVETDSLIASGALIRCSVLKTVGWMRADLFIDFVDTEWGLRARHLGYKSYGVPNAILGHSVGEASVRILGKDLMLHNDIRNYYRLRNATYLISQKSMGWRWRSYMIPRIASGFLLHVWFSKNRVRKFRLMLSALRDGFSNRLGSGQPWSLNCG